MNIQNDKQTPQLKDSIFKRIEEDHVCPRSRMFFRTKECSVWAMWFLSVVVGALAIAVSVFVVSHRQYAIYEATHNNFLTYFVDILPYLWVVVFGLMTFLAVYNLKHTKRGYRYPVPYILASSIILSFAAGSALQFFGLGYTFDQVLGERMAMYKSQEKVEQNLWQAPEDGRLIGRQVLNTLAPTSTVVFEDSAGDRWRMEVFELHPEDVELLSTGRKVRILGKTLSTSSPIFHACGVFPWMLSRGVTMNDMSEERKAFVKRAYDRMHEEEERIALMEQATYASSSPKTMAICTELAVMKRIMLKVETGG